MKFIIVLISFWGFAGVNGVHRFGPGDGFMCHCTGSAACNKTTGSCAQGCSNGWFGPGCQYRDLAQLGGEVVSQSQTKNNKGAGLAVDGNEDTCSRTRKHDKPYWTILLPHNETIIELYLKLDEDKLHNFAKAEVFVEYVPPRTSSRAQQTERTSTMSELCYDSNNISPTDTYFVIKCSQPLVGNQVRMQIDGKATLDLCDVRINGGRNLAFGKRTKQSSTLHNREQFDASKAIDGDIESYSITKNTQNPTWSVFLDHEAVIQRIRLNYDSGYTRNFEAVLLPGTNLASDSWLKIGYYASLELHQRATGFNMTGTGNVYLKIFEVGLFGDCTANHCGLDCKSECQCNDTTIWNRMSTNCSPGCKTTAPNQVCEQAEERVCDKGFYGTPCTKCGQCFNHEACDKTNGQCPRGCQPGYEGDLCKTQRVCDNGYYGTPCTKCGKCLSNVACDKTSGTCPRGCQPGYEGDLCKTQRVCDNGFYGTPCTECGQCFNQEACDITNGKCPHGCQPGYEGDLCNTLCSINKYGQWCSSTCNANCMRRTCNHLTGKCDDGCKDGWQGDKCDRECSDRTYGQQCSQTCSADCKGGLCNHVTGHCDRGCVDTRYGSRCENTCSDNCFYKGCQQIDGNCTNGWCKPGWKGSKCENECSIYKYGTQCASTCSTNCMRRTCNHVTGKCDDGCKDGWQGDKCDRECHGGTYGQQCTRACSADCKDRLCNHVTGNCDSGCVDNKYGGRCQHTCNNNCRYRKCHQIDGNCTYGLCKPGWKGSKCENECPGNTYGSRCNNECSTHCKRGTCDHVTGKCDGGCKAGWQGDTCESKCPRGKFGDQCDHSCSTNCLRNCHFVTGKCGSGCKKGWMGEFCDRKCPDGQYGTNCSRVCSTNCKGGKCNHTDGQCEMGCTPGLRGRWCRYECYRGKYGDQCSNTCSEQCRVPGGCNNVNGSCVNGCKDGWWGEKCGAVCRAGTYGRNCESTCNSNCKNGVCNHILGTCTDGCLTGWKGNKCLDECSIGTYGDRCEYRCNENCRNGRCRHTDGQCEYGCKDGWHGAMCTDACLHGKWGNGCRNNCGNCSDGTCDSVTGYCSGNCSAGYKSTSMCDEVCDDGFYGSNCSETCGRCNNGSACNKVSGECLNGCSAGYIGDLCLAVLAKQASAGITIPVGIGAGAFLLLVLAVIALFVKLGRSKRRPPTNEDIELRTDNTQSNSSGGTSKTYETCPPCNEDDARSKTRVQVSKLLQFVKQNLANKEKLISEFQTIPYGLQYTTEIAKLGANIGKNRYKEIHPYDHSRVVLTTVPGVSNSDYINASFIQGHFHENAYIAAQGPTEVSVNDFWRMVWEKNIRTIAMLTNLVEDMKRKCIQYWGPPNVEMTYGNLTVSTESEHIFAEYTIRRFKVYQKKEREHERTVTQFHYTAWPDKGVPRSTSSLVQFWNVVRQADSLKTSTWLVHCSAGIGRTGTFIAMDKLYDEGEDLGTVDIRHCVHTLRDQRLNMVQTKEQYKFLHGLLVEMLVLQSKQIHVDAYAAFHLNLQTIDIQSGKSALLLQYESLQNERAFMDLVYDSCKLNIAGENEDRFAAAKLEINKSKNRYKNVLPANEFRPFLISNVPGCTNYINAVYVQSYCNVRGYILTQTPMKETAIDCFRLVIEEGVNVIVTFNYKAKGVDDVGEYLPANGTINLGPFTCTMITETDEDSYVLRTHRIFYSAESQETTVYQMIFKNWPTQGIVPSDTHSILKFLQAVEFYNRRENGKAIIVQCLNGAERSGLFVVLMNIMEHIRYESRVSIPHLIRCARIRRQQVIPNFEQYKFCHDVLLSYVENNTTYANM